MMTTTKFSTRVRAHRLRLGLSQAAIARRLGLSRVTWNRWERGHQRPSPAVARLILTVLKNFS